MNEPSDRELLIRLDERVGVIHDEILGTGTEDNPGLKQRVRSLEDSRTHARGMVAGLTAAWTAVAAAAAWAFEWVYHGLRHIGK
jgi:hypothetical protein